MRSKGDDPQKKVEKRINLGAEGVPAQESLRQGNPVTIIHFHLPGDPASEQLADIFNAIQKKYGRLVTVNRAGFQVQPEDWRVQKKIKLPYVMMIVGKENAIHVEDVSGGLAEAFHEALDGKALRIQSPRLIV